MRTNRKRVALPFLFRAADCRGANGKLIARAYGAEVEGVFTRAGAAFATDTNGRLFTAPHSLPRIGIRGSVHSLLLEDAATNLCIRSEDFSSWTDSGSCTVSTNAAIAPDGATTADLLTATTGGASSRYQVCTFTGNATKAFGLWLKAGTGGRAAFGIYDNTAATYRHLVYVTWTAGVPALSTNSGSGTLFATEYHAASGMWRLSANATGVLAANTNRFYFFPDIDNVNGTCYAWGAQTEDATTISSYVATAGSTVARVAEACYFPFTAPPQLTTLYVRGIARDDMSVAPSATRFLCAIGESVDPILAIYRLSGSSLDRGTYVVDGGSPAPLSTIAGAAIPGDVVEYRLVLPANGAVVLGRSINAGTESVGSAGTTATLDASYITQRIHLGSRAGGTLPMPFHFTHVGVDFASRTLAEMRELAEVY